MLEIDIKLVKYSFRFHVYWQGSLYQPICLPLVGASVCMDFSTHIPNTQIKCNIGWGNFSYHGCVGWVLGLKWKPWCWDLDLSWYHHVKNDGCHRDLISLSIVAFFFLKESLILTYNFSYPIKPKNTELSLSIVLVINKACFA